VIGSKGQSRTGKGAGETETGAPPNRSASGVASAHHAVRGSTGFLCVTGLVRSSL